MRVFVGVVEKHGFTAASRSLSIPLPTVCRKIAELEKHIGAQLLIRSTRKVVVTDQGRRGILGVSARILDGLAEAEAEAAGEYLNPLGQLTITAPALFGKRQILPILRDFMAEHPDVTARLLFTNFVVNLLDVHADLGIRIGNLRDVSLTAKKVGEVRHCYCASPRYLAKSGIARSTRRHHEARLHNLLEIQRRNRVDFQVTCSFRLWPHCSSQDHRQYGGCCS